MRHLRQHLAEYVSEATCLALFMVSATTFALLLQLPVSPFAGWTMSALASRVPMGLGMGLTAAALIYSPAGQRSGPHMNPAVTLAFLRLRKISPVKAVGYIVSQFIGGIVGVAMTVPLFDGLPADASVNFVATTPGPDGPAAAFAAEFGISFLMMATVLGCSRWSRLAHYTGLAAATLVALFIVFEAPLSGMSMNPARSLGSAVFGRSPDLWIYFIAPPLGMLGAAEAFVRIGGDRETAP